jgi:hypothetical protein
MTGPQKPVESVEEDVYAEYGVFTLQAHYSADIALALGRPGPGELLRAGRGGISFRSGAFDHFARVRVELWPARPPQPPGDWEESAEGVAVVDSAQLRLASATAWISSNPVDLPAPGEYSVYGAVSGREAAHERMRLDRLTGSDEPPRGLERWLVRLWPAPGTRS